MALTRKSLSGIAVFALLTALIVFLSPGPAFCDDSGKVVAYYFHTTFRCNSCRKIEQYTKEALAGHFSKELESGLLVFEAVNVGEKENEHYVADYKLYTKSVVLSFVVDGKEVKHKNLDQVWRYLGDKDKFYSYIRQETESFLKMPYKAGAP